MNYLKANIDQPLNFVSAGNFIADKHWKHNERTIKDYEVIIVIRGTVYLQIDDLKYALNPGDALLVLPNHVHKGYEYSEKGTSFYWCHFRCSGEYSIVGTEEAAYIISLINNNSFFYGLDSNIFIPSFFEKLNIERVSVLFRQLLHFLSYKYYTKHGMNYLVTLLMIELTEQCIIKSKTRANISFTSNKLQKMLEWIRIHISSDISLANVAYEFNYSKEYLARFFKNKMGMSMQQYIHILKVSKAKELLCESDKSIKEISQFLGFNDEKYFMKLFKKHESITPTQFKNAYNLTYLNNH